MKSFFQLLACLLLLTGTAQAATNCATVTQIPRAECESLLEFYHSTDGPNWKNNTGWNVTQTPCSWFGVTCASGKVTELLLSSNQLSGSIPNFSNLPNLQELYLYNNQLSGSIPNFSNLTKLEYLWLSENQLSGEVPSFVQQITDSDSYQELSLSKNCGLTASNPTLASFLMRKTRNGRCGGNSAQNHLLRQQCQVSPTFLKPLPKCATTAFIYRVSAVIFRAI